MAGNPHSRLTVCLALSAALHAALLIGWPLQPLARVSMPAPLEAVLLPAEPAPAAPIRPKPRLAHHAEPRKAPPAEKNPPATPLPEAPLAIPVQPALPTMGEQAAIAAEAEAAAAALAAAAQPPQPASPATTETPVVRRLPRRGNIVYQLYLGSDGFNVGRTMQSWSIGEQRYQLSSFSETTGLAALVKPYQLSYQSAGSVGEDGLQPESFTALRGAASEKRSSARLQWEEKVVQLVDDEGIARTATLPTGTQDLLSFAFQLGLTRLEPGRMQLAITNGAKLEYYVLEIGAEETIELPLGSVRAIPIRKVRARGEEGIEIWLAPEYHYLPVRVRFLDREGKQSGEQLASEIRASDERDADTPR